MNVNDLHIAEAYLDEKVENYHDSLEYFDDLEMIVSYSWDCVVDTIEDNIMKATLYDYRTSESVVWEVPLNEIYPSDIVSSLQPGVCFYLFSGNFKQGRKETFKVELKLNHLPDSYDKVLQLFQQHDINKQVSRELKKEL